MVFVSTHSKISHLVPSQAGVSVTLESGHLWSLCDWAERLDDVLPDFDRIEPLNSQCKWDCRVFSFVAA